MKLNKWIHLALAVTVLFLTTASYSAAQTVDFEVFTSGTMLYSQVPGILFHGKPLVESYANASSGTKVLHTYRPGQEFHPGPMVIHFTAAQDYVALNAGLIRYSSDPISATLRAYNSLGLVVSTDTATVPAGPSDFNQELTVTSATAQITRIELQYNGSLFEAIDDLVISNQGPPAPEDNVAPQVTITDPVNGTVVTTEDFLSKPISSKRTSTSLS